MPETKHPPTPLTITYSEKKERYVLVKTCERVVATIETEGNKKDDLKLAREIQTSFNSHDALYEALEEALRCQAAADVHCVFSKELKQGRETLAKAKGVPHA